MKDNKMIDSRDIKDLHPIVASLAKTLIERAKNELGIKLLITSTLRDNECQAKLYAKGRTAPGPKVTNAKPGQSFHNYGVAFDVVLCSACLCCTYNIALFCAVVKIIVYSRGSVLFLFLYQ